MEHPIFNLLKDSLEGYFVYEIATNTVILQNRLAEDFFYQGGLSNLAVFTVLKQELLQKDEVHLKDMPLINRQNTAIFCDLMAGYFDQDKLHICCKLTPKAGDQVPYVAKESHVKEDLETIPLDALLRITSDIIYHIDLKTKILTHAGAMVLQFGLPKTAENFPECILSANVIHPDDLDSYYNFAQKMSQGIGGIHTARIRLLDQSYEWFEINCTPIRDSNGTPIEILGKLRNIHAETVASFEKQNALWKRFDLS